MRVVLEINWGSLPVDLERVGFVWKTRHRRTVVWKRVEVLVFSSDSLRSIWSTSSSDQRLGCSWWFRYATLHTALSDGLGSCSDLHSSRWSNRSVSSSSHLERAILSQLCQLSLSPLTSVCVISLHDVRLELERELVFAVVGW